MSIGIRVGDRVTADLDTFTDDTCEEQVEGLTTRDHTFVVAPGLLEPYGSLTQAVIGRHEGDHIRFPIAEDLPPTLIRIKLCEPRRLKAEPEPEHKVVIGFDPAAPGASSSGLTLLTEDMEIMQLDERGQVPPSNRYTPPGSR